MDTVGWLEVDMMLTGGKRILFFSYDKEMLKNALDFMLKISEKRLLRIYVFKNVID